MLPIIASLLQAGLPLIAGAFASKGKEVIEKKLGVNLDEALGTEQGRLELKKAEFAHEEFLISAAQASEVRELDYFKEEVSDKQSSRLRDSEFIKAGMTNWRANVMFALSVAVVWWLVYIIWKSPEINEYVKGIFTLVLGRFLGYLDNIYNFEFGSTRASKEKDATISNLSKG